MKMKYSIKTKSTNSFEKTIELVKQELSKQGFGILTEIDIKSTLKNKINVNFNKYIIFGACNPNLAHKALLSEQEIGLLLPCNVIVYELNEEIFVSAIDPESMMGFINNPTIDEISKQVKEKLQIVINNIN
jgi:uncharacterized protein (DUF302 family)